MQASSKLRRARPNICWSSLGRDLLNSSSSCSELICFTGAAAEKFSAAASSFYFVDAENIFLGQGRKKGRYMRNFLGRF